MCAECSSRRAGRAGGFFFLFSWSNEVSSPPPPLSPHMQLSWGLTLRGGQSEMNVMGSMALVSQYKAEKRQRQGKAATQPPKDC